MWVRAALSPSLLAQGGKDTSPIGHGPDAGSLQRVVTCLAKSRSDRPTWAAAPFTVGLFFPFVSCLSCVSASLSTRLLATEL